MCAPESVVYPAVVGLFNVLLVAFPNASRQSVAALVWALLCSQSLHTADLARALPQRTTRTARQAMRDVRRTLGRPILQSVSLTPLLIRVVLQLVADAQVILVLDSTRCHRWELFTLGVKWGGRVLPIAWRVLPYPWPKRSFTPTVTTLLTATLAHWPSDRPVHLLADRGFPSLQLFQTLDQWRQRLPLQYTIRLRAGDYVRVAEGTPQKLADLYAQQVGEGWTTRAAAYHQRRRRGGPLATLVIGQGTPQLPPHQQGPADQARRAKRHARRLAHVRSKGQPAAPQTDRVWALLSTVTTAREAVAAYTKRFATEGTYRDGKGWGLAAVARRETDPVLLGGRLGLWALGTVVQTSIGIAAGRATDEGARARQARWSTTDRLSDFWRGRQVLHDYAYDWSDWVQTTLEVLTVQVARAVGLPPPHVAVRSPEVA